MSSVQDLLTNVFGHNFVKNVVRGQRQGVLVQQQSFGEKRVQVVWTHDVVFPLVGAATQEKTQKLEGLQAN